MSYTSIGAVTATPPKFTNSATTCRPANNEAIGAAGALQTQLNRTAKIANFAPVKVDGVIGKDTVALANRCLATTGIWLAVVTCTQLVGEISYWTGVFKTAADSKGIPSAGAADARAIGALISGPPGTTVTGIGLPSGVPAGGGGVAGWLGRRSLIEKVGLGVGGVAVVIALGTLVPGAPGGRGRRSRR